MVKDSTTSFEAQLMVSVPAARVLRHRHFVVAATANRRLYSAQLRREVQSLSSSILLQSPNRRASESRVAVGAAIGRYYCHRFRRAGQDYAHGEMRFLYGAYFSGWDDARKLLGIRMALGAQPRAVLWQVLAEEMIPVFSGLALELLRPSRLPEYSDSLLFGVRARSAHAWPGGGGADRNGAGCCAAPALRRAHRSDGGFAGIVVLRGSQ